MERPSRRNANKAAKAQAATAGLKDLKDKGLKRFDTLADAEDNNVYDVVRDALRFLSSHAFASGDSTLGTPLPPQIMTAPKKYNKSTQPPFSPTRKKKKNPLIGRRTPYSLPTPPFSLSQVTEEEYAALVNKRRQEYGGFIVGEDGDE